MTIVFFPFKPRKLPYGILRAVNDAVRLYCGNPELRMPSELRVYLTPDLRRVERTEVVK
ncbi:MAG: hypothetical protein L0Z53_02725 [Acidobacteriales bacterium]|nr:hypothetical protein [Terriglobales bacterium]